MLAKVDSPLAIGFRSVPCGCRVSRCFFPPDSVPLPQHVAGGCRRSSWHGKSSRFLGRELSDGRRNCLHRTTLSSRNDLLFTRVCAAPEHADSSLDPPGNRYHPFEDIEESVVLEDGEVGRLTNAETSRTIIEVNNKATLIFSGFVDNAVHENIILPDLPYLTDEHGDIYFDVNNDEGLLQSLIADDKIVQVMIGLDSTEMLAEMEVSTSDYDFGLEEISSEESDTDDDYGEDEVIMLEEEDDDLVSSEMLTNWTDLETMNSCHPMVFAKRIAEAVSDANMDWMDQPSANIIVQGHLRPTFVKESAMAKKHPSDGEPDKNQPMQSGASFYKLEIINIQLISASGNQSEVKIQDFRKACPDVIAHSAANIISRLKAGGEKIIQALKVLCWRNKGIQVEEAAVIGVDSLGFDLRVCSGTQVQTLRFAFNTRATSEFGAERQLYDLLFPIQVNI
ncbi:uncharacterized protein At3g49140-like isoform X1 [Typha angustifolia]|uniref:uncharacterized protein At3g49140-like isoform X1 n=1 Tax=Typha angustifolia TaxID=59011 RepID=UPI003C2C78D6